MIPNSLIPQEYEFSDIGTHESMIFQARINERIEALKEAKKQTSAVQAITEELEILSLSLDFHISQEIRRQETDKTRRALHDAATKARSGTAPIINAEDNQKEEQQKEPLGFI